MNNYYDQIADGYNELYGEEQRKKASFILSQFDFNDLISKKIISNELEKSAKLTLIDLGCGSGLSSEYLLAHLNKYEIKSVKLIMIDPSNGLLEKIKIDEDAYNFDLKLEIINASAETLTDHIYEKIDFLFSLTAMQNCTDLGKALAEIKLLNCPFIISLLYRGKEEQLDEIKNKFNQLNVSNAFKDDKDIYFIKD